MRTTARAIPRVLALLAIGLVVGCSHEVNEQGPGQPTLTVAGAAAPPTTLPTTPVTTPSNALAGQAPTLTTPPGGNMSAQTPAVAIGARMPCAVDGALAAACSKCHGASPTFGAPMPLVTPEDFQRPSPSDPSTPIHKMALARI